MKSAGKPLRPWMTPNSEIRHNSARLRQLANYLRGVPSERVGISLRSKTRYK